MQNNTAQQILDKIKTSNNILINMDTRTDYDALSSSKVLKEFIEKSLNKKATIIHANNINEIFDEFFEHKEILTNTDISKVDLTKYDLIIFLDSGDKKHISIDNKFEIPPNIETIKIDHHETNDMFGKLNYVYHYGSCCTVLYQLFKELKIELPLELLNILAVGLATDTGFFKYDSIKPIDFKMAAELLEKGVKIFEIITKLNDYEHIDQIRFKQLVFNKLRVNKEKRYGYVTLTLNEMKSSNIDMRKVFIRHSELLKYIKELDFSFVIAEIDSDPKYYEVSFRSKDPKFNVKEMAIQLGGGGHLTGAGAKLYEITSIEEALNKIVTTLKL